MADRQRWVIKIGSALSMAKGAVLMHPVDRMVMLRQRGIEVVIVSLAQWPTRLGWGGARIPCTSCRRPLLSGRWCKPGVLFSAA